MVTTNTVSSSIPKNLTLKCVVNFGACSNFPFSAHPKFNDVVACPKAFLSVHEYVPASARHIFSISNITIPNE